MNDFSILLLSVKYYIYFIFKFCFLVWKPRYFRINTLFITVEDALKRLSELKFNKLESPKSYVEFLKLIKSDEFEGNTFVQDIHIKELLVFNSKMKFYKLELYNNGSLIVQDKVSC